MKALKTAFLLTVLTLLLVYGGEALGGRQGMTIGLIMALVMNAGSYFFSDKIALMSSGAKPVTREQAPRLYACVERLAARGNLPVPKVYIIPQAAPNAFATGRNPRHAAVAATHVCICGRCSISPPGTTTGSKSRVCAPPLEETNRLPCLICSVRYGGASKSLRPISPPASCTKWARRASAIGLRRARRH